MCGWFAHRYGGFEMTQYIDEIEIELVKDILTEEEYLAIKSKSKQLYELTEEIRELERNLAVRLKGRVIGKITKVKFNYLAWGNTFYVSYDSNKPKTFWDMLKGRLL